MERPFPVPESILLGTMALDLGGAETHVVTLARELKNRGRNVTVVSRGGTLERDLHESGIQHICLPLDSRAPWRLLEAERKVSEIIIEHGIRLCHAHGRIPAWVLDRAINRVRRKGRRVPLVTTYHGLYNASLPFRIVTKVGDMMIAVSDEVKEYMIHKFGINPSRVTVIPNGVDTERFRPMYSDAGESINDRSLSLRRLLAQVPSKPPERACIQEELYALEENARFDPVVLHISRLTGKFAETALALSSSAETLLQWYPDLLIVLVGDGDRSSQVAKRVSNVNERAGRNAVVYVGPRNDVERLLSLADLVVGVGRVALEGMSCGKPVLIAGESGIAGPVLETTWRKLAEHNFTARSGGRPLEAEVLASGIRETLVLLEDSNIRKKTSDFLRSLVVSRFSVQAMTDRIERLYAECLAARRFSS